MPRRRHRWSHAIRSLLLLTCALGLALQPVLASLGGLHELTAHAAEAPRMTDGAGPHSIPHEHDAASADDLDHDSGTGIGATAEALHALLHFAHCCGHTPALGVPSLQVAKLAVRQGVLPAHALSLPPSGRAMTPFRPPITA